MDAIFAVLTTTLFWCGFTLGAALPFVLGALKVICPKVFERLPIIRDLPIETPLEFGMWAWGTALTGTFIYAIALLQTSESNALQYKGPVVVGVIAALAVVWKVFHNAAEQQNGSRSLLELFGSHQDLIPQIMQRDTAIQLKHLEILSSQKEISDTTNAQLKKLETLIAELGQGRQGSGTE